MGIIIPVNCVDSVRWYAEHSCLATNDGEDESITIIIASFHSTSTDIDGNYSLYHL